MVITDYKNKEIKFTGHVLDKLLMLSLEKAIVFDIIKTGRVIRHKSSENKIVLRRYYGKCNKTYYLVVQIKLNFAEAITIWQKQGR